MPKKLLLILAAAVFLVLVLILVGRPDGRISVVQFSPKIAPQSTEEMRILAKDLEVPWAMAFLPNGDLIFSERPGNVKLLKKGSDSPILVAKIEEVKAAGEGGLLGIAVSPQFVKDGRIFLYYTYSAEGNRTANRVARYKLAGGRLAERTVVVDAIPGAVFHNGGRIKFGPDDFLYITTGDSLEPSLAQDTNSLAGKILRVDEDGNAVGGNPFGTRIYSYGHRNPQGLAWDESGRLWETEHGQTATDEVNLIEPGKNYGWPEIRGDEKRTGMVSPIAQSGASTWAPAGAAYFDGYLFFAGLRGEGLFRLSTTDAKDFKKVTSDLGRIREAVLGPDNFLYIATSNRDGRGQPKAGDDKIIRIDPAYLPNF